MSENISRSYNPQINIIKTKMNNDTQTVGFCKLCISDDGSVWSIASWHVNNPYQKQGYGLQILKEAILYANEIFGLPVKIEYIWDADNDYVLNWIRTHFDAEQKTQDSTNDWAFHTYYLNKEKFFNYLGLEVLCKEKS